MQKKSILFVIQHAPYGDYTAQETLDAALAATAFEQDVHLLFSGDGVWSLLPHQHSEVIARKNIEKSLQALPYYDIDNIYIDQESLTQRNLTIDHLSVTAQPLPPEQLAALVRSVDCVIQL